MSTVVKNTGPYVLTKTWMVDGDATDVGTVTIGIVDATGTDVVASGTATTNNADGTYTYSLASQSACKLLTITWTRSDTSAALVDTLEVTGGRLFTEAAARAETITGAQTPLSNTSTYPDATIATIHDEIVDAFEAECSRSFIPRYCRINLPGNGTYRLPIQDGRARTSTGRRLPRPGWLNDIATVISVTVDGTAVTTTNVIIDGAALYRTDAAWALPATTLPLNVVVEYEYGLDPTPEATRHALKTLLHNAVPSNLSAWAIPNAGDGTPQVSNRWAWPVDTYRWLQRNNLNVGIG